MRSCHAVLPLVYCSAGMRYVANRPLATARVIHSPYLVTSCQHNGQSARLEAAVQRIAVGKSVGRSGAAWNAETRAGVVGRQ